MIRTTTIIAWVYVPRLVACRWTVKGMRSCSTASTILTMVSTVLVRWVFLYSLCKYPFLLFLNDNHLCSVRVKCILVIHGGRTRHKRLLCRISSGCERCHSEQLLIEAGLRVRVEIESSNSQPAVLHVIAHLLVYDASQGDKTRALLQRGFWVKVEGACRRLMPVRVHFGEEMLLCLLPL